MYTVREFPLNKQTKQRMATEKFPFKQKSSDAQKLSKNRTVCILREHSAFAIRRRFLFYFITHSIKAKNGES